MELELAALFNRYGSDKDRNGYSHVYSILFDHLKDKPLNVLEIGIGTMTPNACSSMKGYMPDTYKPGASLRAWRDYFPNAKIWGMDVQPDTQFTEERIETRLVDSTCNNSVNAVMKDLPRFDIIIDDGYHLDNAQKLTLRNFFPYLKEDGIYVIEDIYPGSNLTVDPKVVGAIIGAHQYFFTGLKNNQCVIRKRYTCATGFC